jgi:hypothetical protein
MARILLVGSEDQDRSLAGAAICELSSHEVVECSEGRTALALVAKGDFDLCCSTSSSRTASTGSRSAAACAATS